LLVAPLTAARVSRLSRAGYLNESKFSRFVYIVSGFSLADGTIGEELVDELKRCELGHLKRTTPVLFFKVFFTNIKGVFGRASPAARGAILDGALPNGLQKRLRRQAPPHLPQLLPAFCHACPRHLQERGKETDDWA
jgi:hypothetical protein